MRVTTTESGGGGGKVSISDTRNSDLRVNLVSYQCLSMCHNLFTHRIQTRPNCKLDSDTTEGRLGSQGLFTLKTVYILIYNELDCKWRWISIYIYFNKKIF